MLTDLMRLTAAGRTIDRDGIDRTPYGQSDPACTSAVGCHACNAWPHDTLPRRRFADATPGLLRDMLATAHRHYPYGYAPQHAARLFADAVDCASARELLGTVGIGELRRAIAYAYYGHRGALRTDIAADRIDGPADVARAVIVLRLAALAAATPGLAHLATGTVVP